MTRSDIERINAQFVQGLEAGDAGAVARAYAPGGQLLAPNAEPLEGAGIEDFWSGVIGQGVRGAKLETVSLDERDDLAVEVGRYTLWTQPDGGEVVDAGKYVVIHRRQPDGSWRYGVDIFNSSRPAP